MGMGVPEGEAVGRAWRQNDVKSEPGGDLRQYFRTVDRFGPRLQIMQGLECGLNREVAFTTLDFRIQNFGADAQFGSLGFADAVVLSGCEPGESAEGGLIVSDFDLGFEILDFRGRRSESGKFFRGGEP